MVFDSAGPVTQRRLLHCRRAIAGAHRCFHRGIQRDRRAIRLDQEKGPPAAVQKSPYHSTLIPGTSDPLEKAGLLILDMVGQAASIAEANYQQAAEVSRKLSAQLRGA